MKPDGGPAFPTVPNTRHKGITVRDYFAAQVLMGLAANPSTQCSSEEQIPLLYKHLANISYELADVMLAKREE
jgi:hypothetical protein